MLIADAAMEDSVALKRAIVLAINNKASLTLSDIVADVPNDVQTAIAAESILNKIDCSLLAIKLFGFVSPVSV